MYEEEFETFLEASRYYLLSTCGIPVGSLSVRISVESLGETSRAPMTVTNDICDSIPENQKF